VQHRSQHPQGKPRYQSRIRNFHQGSQLHKIAQLDNVIKRTELRWFVGGIRDVYRSSGQGFLILSTRSQYPRSCFFDSPEHLNEDCQIIHSTALGQALAACLDRHCAAASCREPFHHDIDFSQHGHSGPFLGSRWSSPDTEGCWALAPDSILTFCMNGVAQSPKLTQTPAPMLVRL
jgi:hypothetical protein